MPESLRTERAALHAYLAALPPQARARVRAGLGAIRGAVPGARLGFSYRMPLLRLDGRPLLWVGAFAHHVGIYPLTPAVKAKLAQALAREDTAKGTLRFPHAEPLRLRLVARIAAVRASELRGAGARAPARRKRGVPTPRKSRRTTS